ncbi:hypothetical protein P9112_010560 [Eukaryota sp. TZLM1-RC]
MIILFTQEKGVKQGDPISPFLYSLGTSTILNYLNEIDGIEVVSYLDDTYVLCQDHNNWSDIISTLSVKFDNIGLSLNLSKTKVFSVDEDLEVLKVPIGSDDFESTFIENKVNSELLDKLKLIDLLPIQNQLILFGNCINSILMYWARTVPDSNTVLGFSKWVHEFNLFFNFSRFENWKFPNLIHMPLSSGGLGLQHMGFIAPVAFSVSLYHAARDLDLIPLIPAHFIDIISSTLHSSFVGFDNIWDKHIEVNQRSVIHNYWKKEINFMLNKMNFEEKLQYEANCSSFASSFLTCLPTNLNLISSDDCFNTLLKLRL